MKTKIVKGSIVRYTPPNHDAGWYRVSACSATRVNLAAIFGAKVYFKRVPISDVVEDEAEWYKHWQNSETYRSM